jgi:hypothetical protein
MSKKKNQFDFETLLKQLKGFSAFYKLKTFVGSS